MKTENHIKNELAALSILSKKIKCETFTAILIMKLLTNKIEVFNGTEKTLENGLTNYVGSLKVPQYNLANMLKLSDKLESEKIIQSLDFDAISPNNLAILSKILGFKNYVFKRIYYSNIPGDFYITNMSTMTHDKIFENLNGHYCTVEPFRNLHIYDKMICEDNLICADDKFITDVLNERQKIYPGEDISIKMIFFFFAGKKIQSILSMVKY